LAREEEDDKISLKNVLFGSSLMTARKNRLFPQAVSIKIFGAV